MKIGPDSQKVTSIATYNSDTIVVRGHDLCLDLLGKISFTEHTWLLVTGELPTETQRRALDAALVAIAEHGLVPSVQAARVTLAAAPEALQGAVAAGILGCGSVILGAAEAAGQLFTECLAGEGSAEERVRAVISRYRAAKRAIPGYGHPMHKGRDPRSQRLMELSKEIGAWGKHWETALLIEEVIPEIVGRRLVFNVSGAIPAILLDAGYPLLALKGVPILARTASLIGHLLEERTRPIGFALTEAGSDAIAYSGEVPEGFVPGDAA